MKKGQFKIQNLDEIRECTECKERKIVTEFVKGKGELYRYFCKGCRQKARRTGKISETRFKKGDPSPGKLFEKGHTPWYKLIGAEPSSKGKGIKRTRCSSLSREWVKNVKDRDKKCMKCGSTHRLAAHHIVPWVEDEEKRFDLNNGIALCCSCHAKEEWFGIKIRP